MGEDVAAAGVRPEPSEVFAPLHNFVKEFDATFTKVGVRCTLPLAPALTVLIVHTTSRTTPHSSRTTTTTLCNHTTHQMQGPAAPLYSRANARLSLHVCALFVRSHWQAHLDCVLWHFQLKEKQAAAARESMRRTSSRHSKDAMLGATPVSKDATLQSLKSRRSQSGDLVRTHSFRTDTHQFHVPWFNRLDACLRARLHTCICLFLCSFTCTCTYATCTYATCTCTCSCTCTCTCTCTRTCTCTCTPVRDDCHGGQFPRPRLCSPSPLTLHH
jgi:hypothetical protein